MDSFHQPEYGLRSQFTVKATAKKIAKSMVGKSIGSDQRIAPNVPPVARSERARVACESPEWPQHSRLDVPPCQQGPPAPKSKSVERQPGKVGPGLRLAQPLAFSASMSAGSTLCTSPTMPRSATEKIGASL